MKKLLLLFLLLPLLTQGAAVFPPATQAEVNAGTATAKFVSPATLTGWSGAGAVTVTNVPFKRTIWVSTTGNDTNAAVDNSSRPYATIQAAFSNVVSSTKVIVLPGAYTVPAKYGGSTGLNYPLERDITAKFHDVTNVVVEGWGYPTLQATSQGTMFGFSNIANVRFSGLQLSGVITNGIVSGHTNNMGILTFFGSNNWVTVEDCRLLNTEGFAVFGGDNATDWRTDNMRVLRNYFSRSGHTNFSYFNGANSPEGGLVQYCGDNGLYDGNISYNCARGIEWFGSGASDSFKSLTIVNSTFIAPYTRVVFADAGGVYSGLTIANNYFRDDQAFTTANTFGAARITATRVKNLIFTGNVYEDCKINLLTTAQGATADTSGAQITFNTIDTAFRGFDLMDDSGAVSTNGLVAYNTIRRCTNFAVRVAGANHRVIGNNFIDCGSAANNGVIYVRGAGVVALRPFILDNTISDSGSAWTTYGVRLEDSSVISPTVSGNRILAYQGHPIFDGGSVSPYINQILTNGMSSINGSTNLPLSALDLTGTNRLNHLHFKGGQASNSFLYLGANTNVAAGTFGSGLTFSGGTLTASGGGSGGTNYPAVLNLLGGTNIAVGVGTRQYWTLTTNAAFNLNFQGTPLNGEAIRFAVSNFSASTIYMTNRQGGTITAVYQPALGSNNSVFVIPATSMLVVDFTFHTNFNNGAVRQEVQYASGLEYALAVGSLHLAMVTNGATVTVQVTNFTGTGGLVASNGPVLNLPTLLGANASSITTTNGVVLMPTNANTVTVSAANSNALGHTRILGYIEAASATPIFLNCSTAHDMRVTNRVTAATSLVLTNSTSGQELSVTFLGEASGGAARVITVIPDLGHLVANLDIFGTALAANMSFTLTNGNAVEINSKVQKLNGTNVHSVVTRQFAF